MRMLTATVGAVLLFLAAGPAFAGDPRGGGHAGGGHPGGGCGASCGGGGHPAGGHGSGHMGGGNINVNINANANASASAGASARSSLNARAYDVGGIRGGGGSYGAVYVGGGYGGDVGGYYGGGAIYGEVDESRICASAPFGYVVTGFGRNGRRAPTCLGTGHDSGCDRDRGGRYGYSEARGCRTATRRTDRSPCGEPIACERRDAGDAYGSHSGGYREVEYRAGGYGQGDGRDCDCRHDDRPVTPYPPRFEPEPEPAYPPVGPHRPRPDYPSRPTYDRNEPGERG